MSAIAGRQDKGLQVAESSSINSLMQIISNAATDPNYDANKLMHLLEVKEKWEAQEARKAFVKALNDFKANPPTLSKNKRVSFKTSSGKTEYDHASLDHVSEEIGKALAKHNLSHRWDVEQLDGGMIRVTCVLTHSMGHSERVPMQAGSDQSGGKNNIQAIGSTVTYLERYTLLAATGMAVKGQDDDGKASNPVQRVSKDQELDIVAKLQETDSDEQRFLQFFGRKFSCQDVKAVSEIPADLYDDALALIENNAKKKGAQ